MNIFYVGYFIQASSTYSHAIIMEKAGHNVFRYNYREVAKILHSTELRDRDLINTVNIHKPDFVLIAKGNTIQGDTVKRIKEICPVVIWYMDSTVAGSWTKDLEDKMKEATAVFCEKAQALKRSLVLNPMSFQATEGYDPFIDIPYDIDKDIDISFIGSYYGRRKEYCEAVGARKLTAYWKEHAVAVSRSKITLNFCTLRTVSDRLYKVLGAKGFIISDDWEYRGNDFIDGKDLVLFDGTIKDLQEKTIYYLHNTEERKRIAENGYRTVRKYNKFTWLETILETLKEKNLIK
jgi:spore maturation protein CgeB